MGGNVNIGSILKLAGTVLLGLLLWLFAYQPLAAWKASTINERTDAIFEQEALKKRITSLTLETQSYGNDGVDQLIWQAEQIGEVTARVQTAINAMAQENGVVMRSIGPNRPQDASIGNVIGFQLEFEATLDRLSAFLQEMEFQQPVLLVSRANLRRLVRPGESGLQPQLFIQINVIAPIKLLNEVSE